MDVKVELRESTAQPILTIRYRTSMDKISENIGMGFDALFGYMAELGEPPSGPPFTMYHGTEFDPNDMEMEVCVPVNHLLEGRGEIEAAELPGGTIASAMHKGPYSGIEATYRGMMAWLEENGYRIAGPLREAYLNDPSQVKDESELLTEVTIPVEKA